MALVEISCPRCHAPLDPPAEPTSILKCRFCGASFRDTDAPAAKTRMVPAIVLERVGPSNRARALDILARVGGMPAAEAERVIQEAPCEAVRLENWERAEELAFALREAGATARVEKREIVIPPPVVLPDRSVRLDAVGEKKAADEGPPHAARLRRHGRETHGRPSSLRRRECARGRTRCRVRQLSVPTYLLSS